ncbi:mucin-19-like isoform X1 [Osmia bicornis bicornis]|uniref:mucin-19-like isoform X1 n=1 Tax=Osmia bicornis bicornis TaxID=1437191 RepID=UPI001EAF462F|nr:mucin-19-like isoform X1 [Osmia bicornis bicornis]
MVRRFSWCTTVALVVLLFVTTEGLRERSTQVDDQKTASRGSLRYNTKSLEESTTVSSLSRSRSSQDRKKFSNLERYHEETTLRSPIDSDSVFDSNKHSRTSSEASVKRRNGKRYSPERTKSKDNENETSKVISRRVSNGRVSDPPVTERLDNKGPSVFAITTESSRSRTGRKIQTTYSTKDLKTQIPTSRRYNNKKAENTETTTTSFRREGRGRSTTERIERSTRSGRSKVNNRENNYISRKGQEAALFESESVRVDIPLAVEGTENPSADIVTTSGFGVVSQRRSDTKETLRSNARIGVERSKGRGRSNDSEVAGSSRNSSRRGSSKFNDFSTTEANEQIVSSRKNTARDRSKGLESRKNAASESRSRSRGRGSENNARNGSNGVLERDAKRKVVGERKSLDRRSRLSETTPRSGENRGQDQDSRRSRSRARPDATTILTTDVTTTIAPDTTVFTDVTSESEMTSITMRPATPIASTTSSRPATTTRPSSSTTSTTEGSGRGRGRGRGSSQGRKQQKEDFFNHGLGFRGRKPSLEGASNTGESRKPSAPKNDSQYHGNFGWTLRRRPPNANYSDNLPKAIPPTRDQTNEVIPSNELSTSTEVVTTVESSTSTMRRGFKKLQTTEESTTEADAATKGYRRGGKTFGPGKASDHEESDNYPPEFKARLTQLKTTNTKIPASKTTSRTPLEVKRSSAALFAERSRMKLELARRLVKPELNIEENDLDATTASSFSKPKPTVLSTVDETSKVTKFVKPSQTSRRSSTEKRSKENEKASKVSASGSTVEDSSSRLARPNSKKGRIISERMVTSISVEERAAIEDTTKPYASTVHSVVTSASAEEGSATTIDSTRIRLSNFRNGKKSKEENSTNKRRIENHHTITTFKPKKPYAYQPRGTKLQEQSTTPVQSPVASSKKTYASPKYNGGQRKSQTSLEEDANQRIKSTGVTKPTFRPRYSKRTKQKSIEDKPTDFEATITTKVPIATSRYSRKKAVVKATEAKSKATTEGTATQTKKLEFRPRTATYRRHSDVPTTLVEVSTKVDGTRVAITPRSTKFSATLKPTESTRSVAQEPQMNLKIANDTTQDGSGITGSSNGDSGNTNIFSPTRSTILTGNNTLLEQLRSTVAPLLNSLGNKTPVFSGSYSNVNNANSPPRITPNGSPPRFSARYKGAELFVRKQNNVYQPTVPSITSSSTTPATTVENSGSAPPIDVSSPGEPRLLTLYQALESANIRNEQLQGNASEQADRVLQVDSNATVANDISSNSNNDTTSPSVATTSPQTPDTIANTTLTPRLSEDTENTTPAVTTGAPETPATTEQVTTITEQSTSTEQASISTESSSSTEQASMNADLMSLTEQTSTDATTTTGGLERSQVSSMMTTMEASTTAASTADGSTPGATEVASTTQTGQSTMETTTVAAVSDAAIMNTSENPESNTIPLSETTATQSVDLSSTDIPTTEAISNNMVDAETTTVVPTTTFRPRLIDLAQDILSRLQASLNATTQSSLDSTTTPPTTEISNAIPDSNSTLESLSQLNGIGTPGPGEFSTTGETTTPSAVGSVPTTSSATTTDPSNSMVSTQEANTLDESSPVTTTTPVTQQDSQTVSNTDSTTVGDSNSSSSPLLDVEVTTGSTITTTNDTLLTELMSIAKTLFSEEINDTETPVIVQTTTVVSDVENLTGNEVDPLSNDTLGAIQAIESSSISPDVTTEIVQSTPTTVAMSDTSTVSVDPSQNEVDSTDPTVTVSSSESSTDTPSTTPESNVFDNQVDIAQTNDATTLGTPLAENVESTTTPSVTTDNERTTLSNDVSSRLETGLDTTTQSPTTTQSSETTVALTVNFELTTNTFDLTTPGTITTSPPKTASEQITENVTETMMPLTNLTTVTPELATDTSTNQPEAITIPETTLSTVNTITTTPLALPEMIVEQTTMVSTPESIQSVTDVTTTSPVTTTTRLDVNSMDDTEVTTNQTPTMETTTNTPSETTNIPQTTPSLENETPTVVDPFQDTTSATAQGTAGSGMGQTTEITTPMTILPSTPPSSQSSTSPSLMSTTSSSVETTTTTATMTTTTQTTTKIGRIPEQLSTTQSTSMGVVTVTPMPETTLPTMVTNANIEENLVSTEAGTTMQPLSTRIDGGQGAMNESTTAIPTTATEATTMSMPTTPGSSTTTAPPSPISQPPTTSYSGRFGGSRLTPAPRFSPSSSTRAPLRDYLVYGIYPNKTIVRKRPEDNLIDARNVDSPYVIFGIFPDGRLVRKFPNGTIIPDPPRSPVEVVFSLSTTTTTNRPPPRPYYNQANQGVYNQYQGPVYSNIRRPEPMRIVQSPGTVDLGLTGNAIVGPNGGGPGFTGPLGTPASLPSTNEMSNALVNTQMGTASVTPIVSTGRPATDSQGGRIVQDRERDEATRTKEVGGQRSSVYIGQDKFVNYWTDGASTTNPRVLSVNINSVATAANEGPAPSVPSFENLLNNQQGGGRVTAPPGFPWRDPLDQIFGITTSSPIITASVASNSLDDSAESGNPALPRPINPFVEVFTPFSNTIGMPGSNAGGTSVTGAVPSTTATIPTTPSTTTVSTTTTTMAPTTTTMAPTTTTTTTAAPTTTTTTMAPTTPSQATSTGQAANIGPQGTIPPTPTSTSVPLPSTTPLNIPANLLTNMQQQNAFGTSVNDLVFLNSLLQSNSPSSTTKTLTQVEQLLANKILSLALNGPNPGPTRAPKAINYENASPNSVFQSPKPSYEPIVIDLSPSSTAKTPAWKSLEQTSQRPSPSSSTPTQITWNPVTTTTSKRDIITSTISSSTTDKTTLISTTKAPVTVSSKPVTTPRPRTTTEAPLGFAGLLWQTLLGGGGLFGPSTTQRPVKSKPVKTVTKSVNITPKPPQTTPRPETTTVRTTTTVKSVDISKIYVNTPNSIIEGEKKATTPPSLSTTKKSLLNNPKPKLPNVATSTYSPEEDTKFLLSLLQAVQREEKASGSKKSPSVSQDDEAFLRAILSGRPLTTTPAPQTEISNAALLAALLKAQGIEPETPATNIREQLQLASLGLSVTSAPTASPATTESTTITTRPTSTATRPTDTTKNTLTPRPTSRPRIRTTTWSPSSTYPPPLFSSFSNYATPVQSAAADNSENRALFGATRAFSQFLGAALSGAAQQLQSLVRNGTRIVSEVVG